MPRKVLLHEKRGLVSLAFLLFVILSFGYMGRQGEAGPVDDGFLLRIDSLIARQSAVESRRDTPLLNSCRAAELIAIGCDRELAWRLVNYRDKYGPYRQHSDLLKLYGMDDTTWQLLVHRTRIDSLPPAESIPDRREIVSESTVGNESKTDTSPGGVSSREDSIQTVELIDLNSASKEELMKLRGIGPVLSERILKFRKSLGGFHSVSQLAETYGLPPETFERLSSKFVLVREHRRINVNLASADSLASHSYLPPWKAADIVLEREENGFYSSYESLLRRARLKEETAIKLRPYLSFDSSYHAQ